MSPDWLPESKPFPLADLIEGPLGWQKMVAIWQDEKLDRPGVLNLTEASLFSLIAIHDTLRRGWMYRFDDVSDHWNPKAWDVDSATGKGDCEDWAMAARVVAGRYGFGRGAFRVAVCTLPYLPDGANSHAVLTIWTDRGVFVVDAARPGIWPWADLPYHWVAVENPGTLMWKRINTPTNLGELVDRSA